MKKWTGSRTINGRSVYAVSFPSGVLAAALAVSTISSSVYADQSITAVRVAPSQGSTRVVFDLSGPASYKLFTLDNPSRIVVDFSDTRSSTRNVGIPDNAVVTGVRSAVQANNALRMVLDLKHPVNAKGFVLPPDGQAGHRLVVDIPHSGTAPQTPSQTTPLPAVASAGAAHIYGGKGFSQGYAYPPANKAVTVSASPNVTQPAASSAQSASSGADIEAIKALLEKSGGPFATAAPTAVNVPSVAAHQAVVPKAPVVPVAPLVSTRQVTPPKPVQSVMAAPASSLPKPAPVQPGIANKPAPVVATPAKPLPAPIKSLALARPANMRDVIVAIDAGHGGQDPGAIGPSGIYEKHITLAIARLLQTELSRQEGVQAKLVRTGDYFIPLASRRDIARTRLKADLFVSIHADAALSRAAKGASVFTLSRNGATSSLAAMLADRENKSDIVGGALGYKDKMVASVIADLALEGAMEHSMKVGSTVLRELGATTPLHKRYIEKAGFAVLKSADFPSILVETGFISNPLEESKLRNQVHQQKLARAISRGVVDYFSGNPPPGTFLAWKRDKGASTIAYAQPSN